MASMMQKSGPGPLASPSGPASSPSSAGVRYTYNPEDQTYTKLEEMAKALGLKKGGMIKSSASKRADGCAKKGKTKGRMV